MAQVTIAPGGALNVEFFTAPTNREVHNKMDERLRELEASGHRLSIRRRIGRNTTCPCGSGRKFKKCCINQTR